MIKNFNDVEEFFTSRQNYGIKPGLDRMTKLLELQDNPHQKLKTIHIAGTNGKGSTVNYLKNALIENEYKVGVFQSPSMDDLTGHIFINNHRITKEEFTQLLLEIIPVIKQLDQQDDHPTEFEILTTIAFKYFAKYVDLAIIEVGMGGRGDTTNVITPILSIITNVDLDHTSFLGNQLSEIAYQKAGIIKEKTPVVTTEIKQEALTVIKKEAENKNTPIYCVNHDFSFLPLAPQINYQQYEWQSIHYGKEVISIEMKGYHQMMNSSAVVMALKLLQQMNYTIDMKKALIGLTKTTVPGRFEQVHENPLIIIDGAHNTASIHYFMETVNTRFPMETKHLVFAAFKDKDTNSMLEELITQFSSVTITTFDHPRAASLEDSQELTKYNHVELDSNWQDTINAIINSKENRNHLYFITGSLYFISLVRKYLVNLE